MIYDSIWHPDFILPLILTASQTALQKQASITVHTKIMPNGYPEIYTDVDVFVEQFIIESFQKQVIQTPANTEILSVIGEESIKDIPKHQSIPSMLEGNTLIIDPIDGTRNFINKLPNWSISIALIRESEFREGIIALPVLGEVLFTHKNQVYSSENCMQLSLKDSLSFCPFKKPKTSDEEYLMYSSNMKIQGSPYKCHIDRSCVYSIAKVIQGGYFAFIGTPKIWDLAACIGLFRTLGLPVYYVKRKKIKTLPWKITEEHWVNYTDARYPIIFTDTYEHAHTLVGL